MSGRNSGRVVLNRIRASRKAPSSGPKARKGTQLGNVPSLKEFIHRQAVVRQYRHFLRALNMIDDEKFRKQGIVEVRQQFGMLKDEKDQLAISMAVKEGERKLKDVRSMVGFKDPGQEEDADSWINIKDEEDPRGRVGTTWPWEK